MATVPNIPNHDRREGGEDTGRLRAEADRLRAALRDSQRLATLGTLAGAICHEINNILTPVMSYAEMASEQPGDAALTRKALERAYHGADRASRIASAILALAGGKRSDPASARADAAQAARDALLCLANDPERFGIRVHTDIEPGCLAAIDQVELQQVLLNLILNAVKAMRPSGGGDLSIRASTRLGRGDYRGSTWNEERDSAPSVVIEVRDTGCGIPADRLPYVFQPFVSHRWDQNAVPRTSGTGLGLTICKQLVESSGGSIDVKSQVSVGTCFTIVLPAATRSLEPDAAPATA